MEYTIKDSIKIAIILCISVFIFNPLAVDANEKNDDDVYINQLELKNKLFMDAIDNFGATSPDEAIKIYSDGVKLRSGPLQYSVMCNDLKRYFKHQMEADKNYAWVTGASSPHVARYETKNTKKIDNETYIFNVKFFWEDALGPFDDTTVLLKVKKCGNKWCISNIKECNK